LYNPETSFRFIDAYNHIPLGTVLQNRYHDCRSGWYGAHIWQKRALTILCAEGVIQTQSGKIISWKSQDSFSNEKQPSSIGFITHKFLGVRERLTGSALVSDYVEGKRTVQSWMSAKLLVKPLQHEVLQLLAYCCLGASSRSRDYSPGYHTG